MPTPFHSSATRKATFYSTTEQKKIGLIERIAVIGSAAAIALFLVVDLVKAEGHPTPVATQTTRSIAATGTTRPSIATDEQWAADDSAKGTRPDFSH